MEDLARDWLALLVMGLQWGNTSWGACSKVNCSSSVCEYVGEGSGTLFFFLRAWPCSDLEISHLGLHPVKSYHLLVVLPWEQECSTRVCVCVGVTYESNPSVWWPQWVSLLSWRLWLCALQGADHVQPGPACAETWQVGNGIYRLVSSQHAGPSWVLFLCLVTVADLSPSDLLSYDQQIKNYMHLRWQHSALVYLMWWLPHKQTC